MSTEKMPETEIEEVYQPEIEITMDQGVETAVFPDILCVMIGIPKAFGIDDVELWTHEFTELAIFSLILCETQGLCSPFLVLETTEEKLVQLTVWHLLTATSTVSGLINADTKSVKKLTKNRYLSRFKLWGSGKRAKP